MKVFKTEFEGLLILEPTVRKDSRGHFFEAYNKKTFDAAGIYTKFVQDNQSRSTHGVLRGLHFQKPPFAQTKLVRVLHGTIEDVVVDLRKSEPTYGKHFSVILSSEESSQLFIPKGFAHGFLIISEYADVLYKCDEFYHPESEMGISYNDPFLQISWGLTGTSRLVSEKDQRNPMFSQIAQLF